MRVNGRCCGEAGCFQPAADLALRVGDVDVNGPADTVQCPPQERERGRVVLCDQRTKVRRGAPFAAKQHSDDAPVTPSEKIGWRQAAAHARENLAPVVAEHRGVISAQRRPRVIGNRLD